MKLTNHISCNTSDTKIRDTHINVNTNKQYSRFPYIVGLSEPIKKLLQKVDIKLSFYPLLKISSLYSNLKEKQKITDLSSIVYKIPCHDCSKSYIGTTKNKLSKRLKQHTNDCKISNAFKPNRTALAAHHFSYGHNFDFDKTTLIHRENISKKRYLTESLHILLEPKKVNFKTDTQDLSQIYAGLLVPNHTN